MLEQAANMFATGQRDDSEQLVTLEPDEDGNYQIMPDPLDELGEPQDRRAHADEADETADNRQIVFLDTRALLLSATREPSGREPRPNPTCERPAGDHRTERMDWSALERRQACTWITHGDWAGRLPVRKYPL
jgi:hypothetical protein